jgi:Flp pilus assembly protein TadG
MVVAALAMVALLLFAALAIDAGFVWSSRTQSQNAGDSAALAAAQTMIVPGLAGEPADVDLDGARAEGATYAGANATVGVGVVEDMGGNRLGGVNVRPEDFTFGSWNLETRTFTELTGADLENPELVRAVQVDVLMDGSVNKQSPALLARLLGRVSGGSPTAVGKGAAGYGFTVKNTAIAYLGFKGAFAPGDFNLPVALDSCSLTQDDGSECGRDFCSRTATTPAQCSLERAQSDTNGILCGEFSNTADQNMCWTAFDGSNSAVPPPDLKRIVDDGNAGDAQAGDPVYVDNGDKTTVVDYIRDKMYGCGQFTNDGPAGSDEYGSGFPDSWVRKLPVVECQDENHCSHASTPKILGGVCFEIREVIAPGPFCANAPATGTSRWIKGRALCPNSPNAKIRELFAEHCVDEDDPPAAPGGCNFGWSAEKVVLVK